jgi:PAS domain S-box-containing protein
MQGRFLQCNPAYSALLGYTEEELHQLTFPELVHPADLEANMAQIRLLVEGQVPFFEVENRYLHKSGKPVWVHKFTSILRDDTGRPAYLLALVTNTTERKRAEEALRESEGRLRIAKVAAQLGIYDYNVVSGELEWDERVRELWGVGPDVPASPELIMAKVHPEDRGETQAALDRALAPGSDGNYSAEFRVVNGLQTRWIAATGKVTFVDGRAVRLVGTVQDISQRKTFEAELERLVAERTQSLQETTDQLNAFCYSIAHDLKAPIRAQVGYSGLLLEEFGPSLGEEGVEYLKRLREAAERQAQLVGDLLSHASLDRNPMPLSAMDLAKAVEAACSDLHADIKSKHALIHEENLNGLVVANESSLHLVLVNLLSNAIKFVAPGTKPEVSISTEARRDDHARPVVRLWVKDNGLGIPACHLERIFGVFERLHSAQVYPGTGIGLAIVKRAVERMQAAWAWNQSPARSRFWVELRAANSD